MMTEHGAPALAIGQGEVMAALRSTLALVASAWGGGAAWSFGRPGAG